MRQASRAKWLANTFWPLPPGLALDLDALTAADSLESFIVAVPSGVLRQGLSESVGEFDKAPRALVLEAALDRAYFRELLKRTKALRARLAPIRWRWPGTKWTRSI